MWAGVQCGTELEATTSGARFGQEKSAAMTAFRATTAAAGAAAVGVAGAMLI